MAADPLPSRKRGRAKGDLFIGQTDRYRPKRGNLDSHWWKTLRGFPPYEKREKDRKK
jgi:hypothetical protein